MFSAPEKCLADYYKCELDSFLASSSNSDVVVSLECVMNAINRLKKKKSRGSDNISAFHVKICSQLFLHHITLLFQMIFVTGIVLSYFGIRALTPMPKKGEPLWECSSFRPITVSTTFVKYLSF